MSSPPSRLLVAAASQCLVAAALAQQVPPPVPQAPLVPQAAQVTPRDLRPEPPAPPVSVPRAAPEAAPPHADELFVNVARIVVDDAFPELAAPADVLLLPHIGHRVPASEFYALAGTIEALYQAAGYPLVRVTVPPQSLRDGDTLHLKVLDGFIERVDVQGLPEDARATVSRVLEPLAGRRRLAAAELERALTLAGRIPGVTLRSVLGAGKAPGGTVLVLEGESARYSISLSEDDRLGGSLGPWEMTTQLRLNQPLGLREQEYIYASGGADPTMSSNPRVAVRRVVGGGVIVPLGIGGLQLNPEYTWSNTRPRTPPGALQTESKFQRYTLRLIDPLILEHAQELTLTATLDATGQSNAAPQFDFTFTHDRVRVGRLGLDWSGALGSGHLHAWSTGSQGSGGFGARTFDEVVASQVGYSRPSMSLTFTKLELGLSLDQPLPLDLQSATTLRSQMAKGVLPSSEEFSADGEDALSLFTSGAFTSDEGVTVREELARAFGTNVGGRRATLQPYLFGAVGKTRYKLAPVSPVGVASSYGVGLRVSCERLSFGGEFGRHTAHGGEPDGAQFFFKAQVQF